MTITTINKKKEIVQEVANALYSENTEYIKIVDLFDRAPQRIIQLYKDGFVSNVNMYKNQINYLIPLEPNADVVRLMRKYCASVSGIVRRNYESINRADYPNNAPLVYEGYKRFAGGVYEDLKGITEDLIHELQKIQIYSPANRKT